MDAIAKILHALAGPHLTRWILGGAATLGGVLALFAAKRRGRAQGRAEIQAQNARATARKQAKLNQVRARQVKAAVERPNDEELDEILKRGEF